MQIYLMRKCSNLLQQTKQAKLQSLHNPSQRCGGNLDNVKRENSRIFRNEMTEHIKKNWNYQ
jgi:hypothetical protein